MKKKGAVVCVCLLYVFTFLGFFSVAAGAKQNTYIRIAATSPGSLWYVVAARWAEEINHKVPGVEASVGPGGAIANPLRVATGEVEIGMSWTNNVYLCYTGNPPYKKPHPNLRYLGAGQVAMLQCAVRPDSEIYSYKDLWNKRINPLKVGTGTRVVVEIILKQYGITYDSIVKNGGVVHSLGHGDALAMYQDEKLDAMWSYGGLMPNFVAAAERPGIRLIGLEPNVRENVLKDPRLHGMFPITFPGGVYKGCEEEVPTIGVLEAFCVNENMPDDLAYQITKILYESPKLKDVYKGGVKRGLPEAFDIKQALKGAVIPIHPGAKKYFEERGLKVE